MSYASAANRNRTVTPQMGVVDSEGFVTVGPKGRPLRAGKSDSAATAGFNLRPQRPRKSDIVYVSNVNPELSSDDLRVEIKRRFGVSVRCRRLNPDMDDPDFASFQVFVQPDQAARILDKCSWPTWIIVRPWEKRGRKSGNTVGSRGLPRGSGGQKIETIIGVHSKPSTPCEPKQSHPGYVYDSCGDIYGTPNNWYDEFDNASNENRYC